MTPEQAQRLANMDVCLTPDRMEFCNPDAVFLRLIKKGPYVDSPVHGLYQEDNEWFIDTEVYRAVKLTDLHLDQIQVCKVVQNWWKDDADLV